MEQWRPIVCGNIVDGDHMNSPRLGQERERRRQCVHGFRGTVPADDDGFADARRRLRRRQQHRAAGANEGFLDRVAVRVRDDALGAAEHGKIEKARAARGPDGRVLVSTRQDAGGWAGEDLVMVRPWRSTVAANAALAFAAASSASLTSWSIHSPEIAMS